MRGAHGVLRALHLRDKGAGHAELGDSLAGVAGDVRAVALLDERVRRAVDHLLRYGVPPAEELVRRAVHAERRDVAAPPRAEQTARRRRGGGGRGPGRTPNDVGWFFGRHRRAHVRGARLLLRKLPLALLDRPVREVVGLERVRDVDPTEQPGGFLLSTVFVQARPLRLVVLLVR